MDRLIAEIRQIRGYGVLDVSRKRQDRASRESGSEASFDEAEINGILNGEVAGIQLEAFNQTVSKIKMIAA
jgi:hypothetical protein